MTFSTDSLAALRRAGDALIAQIAGESSARDARSSGLSSIAQTNMKISVRGSQVFFTMPNGTERLGGLARLELA